MNRSALAIVISGAMIFSANVASAQRGQGGSKGKGHVTQTAPKGQAGGHVQSGPKAQGPKTQGPKTHGAPKTQGGGHGQAAQAAKAGAPKSPAATGTTLTLTPVQQKLQQNTNLADKLRTRLPAGTDLMTAAEGFRNLGQFVAAVNVSNNLDIPFTQLKTRMVDDGMSLGQAIQSVRADVNATTEVRRAETDANRIISDADRAEKSKNKSKKKDGGA